MIYLNHREPVAFSKFAPRLLDNQAYLWSALLVVFLIATITNPARAGFVLELGDKFEVSDIYITPEGRQLDGGQNMMRLSGHMYIKKGNGFGFGRICDDANLRVKKTKPSFVISRGNGLTVQFVVFYGEHEKLPSESLAGTTMHVSGTKKETNRFSGLNFSMKWKGERVSGKTNKRDWKIHPFLSKNNVPIVAFCFKDGQELCNEPKLLEKAAEKQVSQQEQVIACNNTFQIDKNWAPKVDEDAPDAGKEKKKAKITFKLKKLNEWHIVYPTKKAYGYDSCRDAWSDQPPQIEAGKWAGGKNKKSQTIPLSPPNGISRQDHLCLYLRKKGKRGKDDFACFEKMFTGQKNITIKSTDLNRYRKACPWNKAIKLKLKIVRENGNELTSAEYRFVLPEELVGKTISSKKIKISPQELESNQDVIRIAMAKHLAKFFEQGGISVEMKSNQLIARVGKAKYIDLAKRLKVKFRYIGEEIFSRQCNRVSLSLSDKPLYVSGRDEKKIRKKKPVRLNVTGSKARDYHYKIRKKRVKKLFVKKAGKMVITAKSGSGCQLGSNTRMEFDLKTVFEGEQGAFIDIELQRRKPALIIVLNPVSDEYFEVSANKKPVREWQSSLEHLWRKVLGGGQKRGLVGEVVNRYPKRDYWSKIIVFRRGAGEDDGGNYWDTPRYPGKRTDIINELVEDVPDANIKLNYRKLVKNLKNRSLSTRLFVLVIGTPYKYTNDPSNSCARHREDDGGPGREILEEFSQAKLFELSYGNDAMISSGLEGCGENGNCWGIEGISLDVDAAGKDNTLFHCTYDGSADHENVESLPLVIAKIPRASSDRYSRAVFKKLKSGVFNQIDAALKDWGSK